MCEPVVAQQRVLGTDISYWNRGSSSATSDGITQAAWDTAHNTPNANGYTRQFAFIRSSRGGTTGLDQGSGTPSPGGSQSTLSRRYDDPDFRRNITRATRAGMFAGPYHFGRPDVAGNTGTDEANHFIEIASAWMRPGYLMPVFDLEAGGGGALAEFSIDFSDRLYTVMGIRPAMYINGNYTSHLVNSATASQLDQLAEPASSSPSVVGPAYPMLWNARYANQDNPESIPVQTGSPKNTPTTLSSYYGPWDDYGNSAPWSFWQYASTVSIPGISSIDPDVDGNVSHGDIEYVKNYLVPAVWWNNDSGDWGTMTNWNSGQPLSTFNASDPNNPPAPYIPHVGAGQATPSSGGALPAPRLPGKAGSGPASTSGIHDTVILERPSADINVTLSSGAYNIRKLYMRETLNITGGSLTINYDPNYRPDNSSTVLHGGPLSAQISGNASLSGTGSLSVHTMQVDATRTFIFGGGSVNFHAINLMPDSRRPAQIAMSGNVTFSPLANATASIKNGSGTGSSGRIDLIDGTNPVFNIADGAPAVDVAISVPIVGAGLTKTGPGTLELNGLNNYNGDTIVQAGRLSVTSPDGLNQQFDNEWDIYLTTGAILDLKFTGSPDTIGALYFDGTSQPAGIWGAEGSGAQFTSPLITGTGRLEVTQYIPPPLVGDFNGDGRVDSADYIVWRKSGGTIGEYNDWRTNFGRTSAGAGSGSDLAGNPAVPEPSTIAMLILGIAGVAARRHR
jgi:autotransporter-associated beta strand protein